MGHPNSWWVRSGRWAFVLLASNCQIFREGVRAGESAVGVKRLNSEGEQITAVLGRCGDFS
jgi:hypothetical protein